MVMSMTGYGSSKESVNNTVVTVEIRSVNHRFLDISTKMPRSLLVIEEKIKKIVQSYLHRGRVEVFITIEGEELVERNVSVNWKLMEQYISNLKEIQNRYQLQGDIPLDIVTKFEDIFTVKENDQQTSELFHVIQTSVIEACVQVCEMREKEGKELSKDLISRIQFIEDTIKLLGERRDIVIIEYRDRIKQRIQDYIKEERIDDESKILHEVALLAEKGDITEEVTRLHSHVSQFLQIVTEEGPIGRKLDFILQEMHRETNTVGSKSNDAQISQWVVSLKSEIEKIKEQVQNVE